MAKKIIVMERVPDARIRLRGVFWIAVPLSKQSGFADAGKASLYPEATAGEIADLRAGRVQELPFDNDWAPGTGVAAIKAALIGVYNDLQSRMDNPGLRQFYGTSWDGTAWTDLGTP